MQKGITIGILGIVSILAISLFLSENAIGAPNKATVKIDYEGSWSGHIEADTGKSIEGTGPKSYTVEGDVIVASAQKDDETDMPLTISIIIDGKVEESSTTTAEYGVANVDYSFPIEDWEGENEGGTCSTVFASIFIFIGAGGVVLLKRRSF